MWLCLCPFCVGSRPAMSNTKCSNPYLWGQLQSPEKKRTFGLSGKRNEIGEGLGER